MRTFQPIWALPVCPSLIALCYAASLTTLATAQDIIQRELAPVIVTSTRTPKSLNDTARDVSVLDGDTLRTTGVADVANALRLLPGIEIATIGPGSTPSIFIRGANSNQTLVLVDGQRIASSTTGQSALQHISIDQIDRIEVLRGPAASLYGADAIGGVIQIFTRRDRDFSARFKLGEERLRDLSFNIGTGTAANGVSLLAAQNYSRGHSAIVNPANWSYNPDRDSYRFNTLQLVGNYSNASNTLKLASSAWGTRGDSQYDSSKDYDDRIDSKVYGASVNAEYQFSPAWRSLLNLGIGNDNSQFDSKYPGTYKTRNTQAVWQNHYRINTELNLFNALEWRRESVSTTNQLPITRRSTDSALLGVDWHRGALRLNGNLRLDDSSQFGHETTGNASLAYQLSSTLRFTLNTGTSFKAPTFNDLYYPNFSNPDLNPEQGRNIDAGLQWTNQHNRLGLIAYQNKIRDLIQFSCNTSRHCTLQNIAQARLRGATFSFGTRAGSFNINGSYNLADPKNLRTDYNLPRRARQYGALQISRDLSGLLSGLEVQVSGPRYDNANNSVRLPGYALVNLYVSKNIGRHVRLGARIDNVTDRDYQLAAGYTTNGRRLWLTLGIDY